MYLKTSMARSPSFMCWRRSARCTLREREKENERERGKAAVPENEHVTLAQLQVDEAVSTMNLFDEGRFGRVKRAHLLYICYSSPPCQISEYLVD